MPELLGRISVPLLRQYCRLLVLLLAGADGLRPQVAALPSLSRQLEELTQRVDPAVVQIITRSFTPGTAGAENASLLRSTRSGGSGVVVSPDGYIVTNAHVIGTVRRVLVLLPRPAEGQAPDGSGLKPVGSLLPAEVVGLDHETDIAVLKVPERNLPALSWAEPNSLRQGQLVLAFGSPFGLDNSVSLGVVSAVARQFRSDDPHIYIQTDAAVNPGNSGGPLVDTQGRVVGINTFIASASGTSSGVGFAVPAHIARGAYEQIRQHGRVRRGQIGVVAQTINPALAASLGLPRDWGVLLADVNPRGSAAVAGLQVKDIVLTLDGRPLANAQALGSAIYQRAGETVTLEVLRGAERLTLRVAVLERPQDPDRILTFVTGESNLVPKLGVLAVELDERVTPLLPALRKSTGVVVAGVVADLSAEPDNRLQAGDVIHEVNGKPVYSVAELKAVVAPFRHGEPVALQLDRQGQLQFLLLEID